MSLNILLLCNKPGLGNDANTIVDHIEAIENYSQHQIWMLSNMGNLPEKLNLNKFDVIIIHYSMCILNNNYLSVSAKKKIRDYKGLKAIFVQDEYRQINKMHEELLFLKVDVLFSCFPDSELNSIYPDNKLAGISKFSNLTGYIPERLTKIVDQKLTSDRPIHVGYRGRHLPYWYGELAYEKWNIVDNWIKYTQGSDLNVDLSYQEKDRIYGKYWIEFLSSCKATLGVESGASVMDFTGELEKLIDFHQVRYPKDSFHDVQKQYLMEHEGKFRLNQISPRCFEAIALKTVLVLYEGEYSGILIPNRHYILLKKDFSNIEEVVAYLMDDIFLQNMANVAYDEIALNPKYSYRNFIERVDNILDQQFLERNKVKQLNPYNLAKFELDIKPAFKLNLYKHALALYIRLPHSIKLIIKSIYRPKTSLVFFSKAFFKTLNLIQKK